MIIKQIIKDWFTGPDGVTYDPARALWILGMFAFLTFTAHSIYKSDKDFDMVNFGLAYGGLLAAGAAGVKIKETSEPAAGSAPAPSAPPPAPKPAATVDDDPSLKPPKG